MASTLHPSDWPLGYQPPPSGPICDRVGRDCAAALEATFAAIALGDEPAGAEGGVFRRFHGELLAALGVSGEMWDQWEWAERQLRTRLPERLRGKV